MVLITIEQYLLFHNDNILPQEAIIEEGKNLSKEMYAYHKLGRLHQYRTNNGVDRHGVPIEEQELQKLLISERRYKDHFDLTKGENVLYTKLLRGREVARYIVRFEDDHHKLIYMRKHVLHTPEEIDFALHNNEPLVYRTVNQYNPSAAHLKNSDPEDINTYLGRTLLRGIKEPYKRIGKERNILDDTMMG